MSNTLIAKSCPRCSREFSAGEVFCSTCGERLAAKMAAPAPLLSEAAVRSQLDQITKAGVFGRLVAFVIDASIVGIFAYAITYFLPEPPLIRYWPAPWGITVIRAVGTILTIPVIGWIIVYLFGKDCYSYGQSLGKRMCGLIVVDLETNSPCTTRQSVIRNLIQLLLNMVHSIGILVEPAFVVLHKSGRRIGDLVAGTIVVEVAEYQKVNGLDSPPSILTTIHKAPLIIGAILTILAIIDKIITN